MLGPVVNSVTIVLCSILGVLFIKNMPERFNNIITKGLGLCIISIGIKGSLESEIPILFIMSIVIGAVVGEWIDIDGLMNRLGNWIERKLGFKEGKFAQGFVTASLLFCTGAMAIVGALQSGLQGNHEMLFAKSILDGTISVVFASQMGIGVAFSAVPVFLYEGGITIGASFVKDYLTAEIIREMAAVGNLLVACIGFNFLEIKPVKVANFIPAIFIPWVYLGVLGLF